MSASAHGSLALGAALLLHARRYPVGSGIRSAALRKVAGVARIP